MKAPENDPIGESTQLLNSLYDEIALVQTFRAKWTLIKSKLDDLRSQLTDFAESQTSGPDSSAIPLNPLSAELLRSVSEALRDAVTLAGKCQSPSLADGKLRTQSEIDSVMARLDRAARDGEILIRSGVLNDGAAVSSSAPPASASWREAARSESRSLVTRLQIGTADSRNSAMDSLLALLREDDKNVMIAVAQGVVPALVRLLDSTSGSTPEAREKAIAAIARVSTVESSKHVLIAEGLSLLNHLLRVLDSGSGFSKEKACIALQTLTFSKENARSIGSRGGISSLLEICHSGTPGSQASAAGVLRNLAAFAETRETFVEENGIIVLLGLTSSGTALAQENSIACLCNLVSDDQTLKISVAKEGGIECLKNFWDSAPSLQSLEVALDLLRHLASFPPVAEALCADGFVPRIVSVLSCGVLGVRIAGARAVGELGMSSQGRRELGESGCIAALIKMLDGKAAEEKEAAAKALLPLMQHAGNRKVFRRDERGIVSLVRLLEPSVSGLDKKHPVAVLAALSHSKKCRKQMAVAGAGGYLQRAAEREVEGAKRLLESLGRGKIWGVFGRI